MKFSLGPLFLAVFSLLVVRQDLFAAPDPEVERLLKKLPPPEKLVKPDERFPQINDPALRDPMVKQIESAATARQGKRALGLARRLATRYPSSALAHCYAGYFAVEEKRYGEASASFRRAIAIQPRFVFAHYCLGFVECQQGHHSIALQHLRQVTKLDPDSTAGWAVLSVCAERAGARQESLNAARRLVVLAPKEAAAWIRLAIAEKNAGNHKAAVEAMKRGVALERGKKQRR